MLCMQRHELGYPSFTLFDKVFLLCLSFPDTEWTRCSFCSLWWHSAEITGVAVLHQLNIRLGVINSASLENPQSSVSKQEIAITPGKDFPQAEVHESVGGILCCEFLWRNETFWFPALKSFCKLFSSRINKVECHIIYWQLQMSYFYSAVACLDACLILYPLLTKQAVSCWDPSFVIFNYNSLAKQRRNIVWDQCGLHWSRLKWISKNGREPD